MAPFESINVTSSRDGAERRERAREKERQRGRGCGSRGESEKERDQPRLETRGGRER